MVQWLRICLPVQGLWVESLVQKISHAAELLSPCATATEPALQSLRAYSSCSATGVATAVRSLCTTTRESPHASMKIQHSCNQLVKNIRRYQLVFPGLFPFNSHFFLEKMHLCLSVFALFISEICSFQKYISI